MTKTLQSLLETAVVVGALIGTPTFVISAFALIDASVRTEQLAATTAQDSSGPGFRAVQVKF